jgi:hypothetical protein
MAHRLNHINPTVGPYMSHIIWFCKGMNVALGSTSANDYETTQGSLCVYKYKIFDNYYHNVSLEYYYIYFKSAFFNAIFAI